MSRFLVDDQGRFLFDEAAGGFAHEDCPGACCAPADLLCVRSCEKIGYGCAECVAFTPEALPFYPALTIFKQNGICFEVSPWPGGTPACIVNTYPVGAIPLGGQCGIGCTDDCDVGPCICDETQLDDPTQYDWSNAVVTITRTLNAAPSAHPACTCEGDDIVGWSRSNIAVSITRQWPVQSWPGAVVVTPTSIDLQCDDFDGSVAFSASFIDRVIPECQFPPPDAVCLPVSFSGSGTPWDTPPPETAGSYAGGMRSISLWKDGECRWRYSSNVAVAHTRFGPCFSPTSGNLLYWRFNGGIQNIFSPKELNTDGTLGDSPILQGSPFTGGTITGYHSTGSCQDPGTGEIFYGTGTETVTISGVTGQSCGVPDFECVPVMRYHGIELPTRNVTPTRRTFVRPGQLL